MSTTALLRSPFTPAKGSGLLTTIVLFHDRVEVRRLGACLRTVPLADVERVSVSTWGTDPVNFRLETSTGDNLAGRVNGVLAWKYKLMELINVREQAHELPEVPLALVAAA